MTNYLIWDFDGTLGYRQGAWSGAMADALRQHVPDSPWTAADIRPHIQAGMPWHSPHIPHRWGRTADAWWAAHVPVIARAYETLGLDAELARLAAGSLRATYLTPATWYAFDDVQPTLTKLKAQGWRHLILSNHVPELSFIIEWLGLSRLFTHVFNSAWIGFEKPHPHAYLHVLSSLPDAETIWMIGDNIVADVQGAQAVGLPAILVRKPHPDARYYCHTLDEIEAVLDNSPNRVSV